MFSKKVDIQIDSILTKYLKDLLKVKNVIEYLKNNEKDFPYDYRYLLLKENINSELKEEILKTYTDEELDLLLYFLESNIYKTTFDSIYRIEDDLFNINNDKKVLKNCLIEYDKRNLI